MKVRHAPGDAAKALQTAIKGLGATQSKVGWFPSARYEDGTPAAYVAVIQEYGSARRSIPARPFFRTTVEEKKAEWQRDSHVLAKAVIDGHVPPAALGEGLAMKAEGDVRRKISKIDSPPLSVVTLLARKARKEGKTVTGKTIGEFAQARDNGTPDVSGVSTKPLVDMGYLLNTLTSQTTTK